MVAKQRLDVQVFESGLAPSREKARAMIMAGEVLVDGERVDKPGTRIDADAQVTVKAKPRFVSRGGEKLAGALAAFPIDVNAAICADVGASTGGFTDCLLQHGAARVYAIDVGYGQLAHTLRQDARVIPMERTNARYVAALPELVDLVTVDASFISLRLLLPVLQRWLKPQAAIMPLIKPQFEAGPQDVGKGGVVRDARVHQRVLNDILTYASEQGFAVKGLIRSPLTGPKGNIEFLAWLGWSASRTDAFLTNTDTASPPLTVEQLIQAAL
ncbi:MAG: TlyA family RNA methyltransferase [Chloroflexi bacterium]|nr:TlyA family RNA methyltransferase [Chloroflexota bacterium]